MRVRTPATRQSFIGGSSDLAPDFGIAPALLAFRHEVEGAVVGGDLLAGLYVAVGVDVKLALDAGIRAAGMVEVVDALRLPHRQQAEKLGAFELQVDRLPPPV